MFNEIFLTGTDPSYAEELSIGNAFDAMARMGRVIMQITGAVVVFFLAPWGSGVGASDGDPGNE